MNGEFTYAVEHLPQMLILIELCDDSGMMELNGPSVHCVAKIPASWCLAWATAVFLIFSIFLHSSLSPFSSVLLMYPWAHCLWQHAQDPHRLKPDEVPALRGGNGHRVPTPVKKLFATDTHWQWENQFSATEESYWAYKPHSRAGPQGPRILANTIKIVFFVLYVCIL